MFSKRAAHIGRFVGVVLFLAGDSGCYLPQASDGEREPNGLATDDDLTRLDVDPHRRQVSVYGFGITDEGVARVAELSDLCVLDLNYTSLSDDGLAHLAGLSRLQTLDLRGNYGVTDAGLKHLHGLRELRTLNLTFTRVTGDGLAELKAVLPEVRIFQGYSGDGEYLPQGDVANAARLGARHNNQRALGNWLKKCKDESDLAGMAIALEHLVLPDDHPQWYDEMFAHQLAYRIPIEQEDVQVRYFWVKQGIRVLLHALDSRKDQPVLTYETGFLLAQKIGRSDDTVEFSRLFRDDTELHELLSQYVDLPQTLGPDRKPNSWLVAQQFYLEAVRLYDEGGDLGDKSPIILCTQPAMAQIYYASALEHDGVFDEVTAAAWQKAELMWDECGDRDLTTSDGTVIRLNDYDIVSRRAVRMWSNLDELAPGARGKLHQQKMRALSEQQRLALEKSPRERTAAEAELVRQTEEAIQVSPQEVAEGVDASRRGHAMRLATQILELENSAKMIARYGVIVNYEYWQTRCRLEQTDEVLTARRDLYQAMQDTSVPEAGALFERAFAVWVDLYDRHPSLSDDMYDEELYDALKVYRAGVLQGQPPPEDSPAGRLLQILEPMLQPIGGRNFWKLQGS